MRSGHRAGEGAEKRWEGAMVGGHREGEGAENREFGQRKAGPGEVPQPPQQWGRAPFAPRHWNALAAPKPPASPAGLEGNRKDRTALATPSAPHRRPHEVRSLPRTPAWEGHGLDYIAEPCACTDSAAQLSAGQQGALFAQFSLPLVNFHLLGYVAREIIPPQFHLTPTTAAAPEVHELRSASAMEEIIPAC